MRIGATFPHYEIGTDPGALRAYAEAVEALGYDFITAYDHVLGADLSARAVWRPMSGNPPRYNKAHQFHEVFTLFAFLSGFTKRVEFFTHILILPQRQTVLVAKQAAEVDVLSRGRLRLGIANGWNDVEYEGLGMDYHNRGARMEEQIALLRALWTQEVVTFHGRWHHVTAAGLNPLPVQRPIPLWLGGGNNEQVIQRAARLADGIMGPDPAAVRRAAVAVGRDVSTMGVLATLRRDLHSAETLLPQVKEYERSGVTHATLITLDGGFKGVDGHIAVLTDFKQAYDRAQGR